jgi:nudix-type nucleoside diphosphatase (YffH/AdpP family)
VSKVEVLSRQTLADAFFRLEEVTLRHERLDGSMSEPISRLNVERGDGAAIVLHDSERDTVTLVRQFRWPTWENGDGWTLELVAGVIEPGRDPEEVARAEALEEAGYRVDAVEALGTFYLTPGGSSERIFLYLAQVTPAMRVGDGGGLAHEGEDIEIYELSCQECWQALDDGRIADAKTLVGLLRLRQRLSTRGTAGLSPDDRI